MDLYPWIQQTYLSTHPYYIHCYCYEAFKIPNFIIGNLIKPNSGLVLNKHGNNFGGEGTGSLLTNVPLEGRLIATINRSFYLRTLSKEVDLIVFSLSNSSYFWNFFKRIILFFLLPSWFRVRNNLLEPVARTSRIFLSGSVLVIDSLRVSIQFPYHYSNVRKSKKKEKPTRKTGDEGRSVAEAAANEPLGDHFPKVGSYAFLTEKRESSQLCGKPESTQAYDFSYSRHPLFVVKES